MLTKKKFDLVINRLFTKIRNDNYIAYQNLSKSVVEEMKKSTNEFVITEKSKKNFYNTKQTCQIKDFKILFQFTSKESYEAFKEKLFEAADDVLLAKIVLFNTHRKNLIAGKVMLKPSDYKRTGGKK